MAIGVDLFIAPFNPSNLPIASASVDVTGNPVLDPGETGTYNYKVIIPSDKIVVGATYKVTAHITITNHSGYIGIPFGPDPSNTAVLPSPTLINDTINVNDSNGFNFPFSTSGQAQYSVSYNCDMGGKTYTNTATIVQTGQFASAAVTVNCFELQVSKNVNTSLTRKYIWDITKVADLSNITLAVNQSIIANYTLQVSETPEDSNWQVNGNITIYNPAPVPVVINNITDVISSGIPAVVMSGVTLPYNLPAGGKLIANYSALLPDGSQRTNTATVTIQNFSYSSVGSSLPIGTTDFSGSAPVDFSNAILNEVDKCVSIFDDLGGNFGPVCAGVDVFPKDFNYSIQIGPYSACGNYTVSNSAGVFSNSQLLIKDTWTVNVNVSCSGCTRTIGYWKNHPQEILNGKYLPITLGASIGGSLGASLVVDTIDKAIDVLNQNVYGTPSNGITKLYAQLLAAKLNIASGASDSAVQSTIAAADAFLNKYSYANWSSLSKANQQKVLGWVITLDNYNNGIIGPGHCTV